MNELVRPSEIIDRSIHDPEVIAIRRKIKEHANDPKWHFSDEENIYDLKERAKKFLHYLEKFEEKRILVVSHAFTIRMIIAVMMLQDDVTPKFYYRMNDFFNASNTGISMCEKTEGKD